MPKPIAVLYLPEMYNDTPADIMRVFNGDSANININPAFQDYLWLCLVKDDIENPELQVFHPTNFTEIELEELKNLVLGYLERKPKNNQ